MMSRVLVFFVLVLNSSVVYKVVQDLYPDYDSLSWVFIGLFSLTEVFLIVLLVKIWRKGLRIFSHQAPSR